MKLRGGMLGKRSTRATALALAIVLAGSQFASFAHFVFVQHVTCADHGELVEVGQQRKSALDRDQRSSTVSQATTEGAGHGHEHCLMTPHRRERTIEASRAITSTILVAPASFYASVAATPRAPPI